MKALIYLISLFFVGTVPAHAWESFHVLKPEELRFERLPSQSLTWSSQGTCRDRIAQITCLVNPAHNREEIRKCQMGSGVFAEELQKIHDVLPTKLQQVFCGLEVIFIENELESLAYAGIVSRGPNDPHQVAMIGIRRSLVERSYDATSVLGWKEQKTFGLKADPFVHLPEGPRLDVSLPGSLSALHYVIVHEFGHILDFVNNANDFVCPEGETCDLEDPTEAGWAKLVPAPNSWAGLSWKTPMLPRDEYHFPLWPKLCFYGCKEQLTVAEMEGFYQQLDKTNFVTSYAAVSPWEDFAESLTFAVMGPHENFHFQVQTPFATYHMDQKWQNLGPKKIWLEDFLNRDLKYPTPLK